MYYHGILFFIQIRKVGYRKSNNSKKEHAVQKSSLNGTCSTKTDAELDNRQFGPF
jgi:hypothetical protein